MIRMTNENASRETMDKQLNKFAECERCGSPACYQSSLHLFCYECVKKHLDFTSGEYKCKCCGKVFKTMPFVIRDFPGIYCSDKCLIKYNRFKEI